MNIQEQIIKQVETTVNSYQAMTADPYLCEAKATYFKKLYDALTCRGFTSEQALKLTIADITSN